MIHRKILIAFLLIMSSTSSAEKTHDVPEKLFGIKLGGIYDLGNPQENDLGNIPVKKFAGIQKFLGSGIHYYFQPKKEYKIFEYVEKREKPEDQHFETSFKLYLLPVIPSTITTIEQLNDIKIYWKVTSIKWADDVEKWSNNLKVQKEAYYWAIDLCKTFKEDISVEPEIYDNNSDWYQCTFTRGDREFTVSSYFNKNIELSYKDEVFRAKDEAVEKMMRKIEANEIRPY